MTTPVEVAGLNQALATRQLRLVPLAPHHAGLLFDGMQHPAIYHWISTTPPPDVNGLAARWARVAERLRAAIDVFDLGWAVQRIEDGTWIGKMDAEVQAHGVATNVGYFFLPPFWGRGYASEAARGLCDHLAQRGVREQRATVTVGNAASGRVLERAGFSRGRTLPANDTIRGVVVDDQEYIRCDAPAGVGAQSR